MIPILYDRTETSFTSNGLGRLSSCRRCIVTEERNGVYECEFDYPVTGVLFSEIEEGRIIACTHDEQGDIQPFDIYGRSEPINGVVTFYAHHISYRQNEITVKPFEAGSATEAIAKIKSQSVNTNPFTYWTNKSVTASFTSEAPKNARDLLMGEEGSMLDVFGTGEYEFDKFNVKLYLHRGQDTNVSIRYGKNLADFQNEYDVSEAYTAVVPYWLGEVADGEESVQTLVMLPELFISSGHSVPSGREVVVPMDLSDEFEDAPTVSELRSTATSRLNSSDAWEANQTVTVDFVQLWQTEEYKEYAPLQRLKLCDTCGVFVPMYDTALRAKVIKVVYNVLLDRYDEMELGDKPTSYAAVLEKTYDSKVAGVVAGFQSIQVDIETAQAIAAADATTKANQAKTDAINIASADATQKANQAQANAISTASADATSKANQAEQNAVSTASADATTKANNAKTQAISSANSYTDGQIASAKSTIESQYEQAIEDATELIRGGTGGYVVTTVNANGQPIELLITDNLDLTQAVNVWRWNQGGLAHSSNGYNGQFNDVAITADGKINASMILTGALTANLITAGTISDANGDNYWNLESGQFVTKQGTIGAFTISSDALTYTYSRNNQARSMVINANGFKSASCGPYASHGNRTAAIMLVRDSNRAPCLEFYDKYNATDIADLNLCAYVRPSINFDNTNGGIYIGVGSHYGKFGSTFFWNGPAEIQHGLTVYEGLTVSGTKSRAVDTESYSNRLLYCYETPTPLFGDIGEVVIDEDGICYVDLDDIFTETIAKKVEYQVFLQKEGAGDCWVGEKTPRYFTIHGTPNLKVAWELKAKQRDYEMTRLELSENELDEYEDVSDTNSLLDNYITEQEELLYGNY